MKTPCPNLAHLTAYALGDLPPKHSEAIRAHLETCAACRAEVAAQTAARDELRSVLLADANVPAALTPERLAAVLATPPASRAAKRTGTAGTPCATSSPWRKVVFAAKVAACLVLFLGVFSAALFPAIGHNLKAAKAMAARVSAEDSSALFALRYDGKDSEAAPYRSGMTDAEHDPFGDAAKATEDAMGRRAYFFAPSGPPARNQQRGPMGGGMMRGGEEARPASGLALPETDKSVASPPPPSEPVAADVSGRLSLAGKPQSKTESVPLNIQFPKPQFTGTPKEMKNMANLEPLEETLARGRAMPRTPTPETAMPAPPGLSSRTPALEVENQEQPMAYTGSASLAGGGGSTRRGSGPLSSNVSGVREEEAARRKDALEALKARFDAWEEDEPETEALVIASFEQEIAPAKSPLMLGQMLASGNALAKDGTSPIVLQDLSGDADKDVRARVAEKVREPGDDRAAMLADELEELADELEKAGDAFVTANSRMDNKPLEPSSKKLSRLIPDTQVNVNPFVKTAAQPLSTFAIGTDTASYTLTRQSLGNGMLPDPSVVRVEEFVNALDYKDSAPERTTFRIISEGAPSPFGRDTHLVRLAIKGRRLGREEQRPANLVFLVDASGSMAQPDRMGAIQLALGQLLQGLRPEDHLQIVTFNETARLVQPHISAAQQQEIMANFQRVRATGPTSLERGMVMAYQQAVATFQPGAENRVILITDGIANLGSGEASDILAQIDDCRRQGIRLSVFGVGRGTYNDTLLQQLANKGDGTYRFLDSPEAITDAFVNDLSATLYTIASDAKVQVEWFPHAVSEYRQLGYEARALTAEQFRDDTVVAGQIGSGQTASALYEISLARTRALPPNAELGIVRIRFRPSEGGAVQEISRPIVRSDLAASFAKARPEFQLAAVAAGFAERLRRSPYAPSQGYHDLGNLIRPAAQQLHLDTRFGELVHLLDTANSLTR